MPPAHDHNTHVLGHHLLGVPYGDDRELLMDLLRHGPEVEVLEPPALRKALIDRREAARKIYL